MDFDWNSLPLYSTYMAVEAEMDINDPDIYGFEVYIPESDYHLLEVGNVYSYIVFYDDTNQFDFTLEFRI